ncbi:MULTISPECIES: YbaB/EbfC family nucleoid-associated protein [Streptomyces]|uniref:Nucleoid-associated protein GCM10010310_63190 n=1 Tax=Streptomyces violaceolatus TaxID=67378 RepID=A0ABN3TE61_9ACTN|nr:MULTISPECIES: YbaB/EbfC family nucleoid-associated protein [Streptomyces]MDX3349457.1 YbaB/EbfC family nucleoid-associated protein [Streptomyces sp. ME02-6979A]
MLERDSVDFTSLADQARQMQDRLSEVQADMAAVEAVGHGGGGLVTATVSGEGRLVALRMDPSVIDPADPETLTDMIIAAVDGAHLAVAKARLKHMTDVTDSIGGIVDRLHRSTSDAGPGVTPVFPSRRERPSATRPTRRQQ